MLKIGVIGFGSRIRDVYNKIYATGEAKVVAVMDVDVDAAKKRAEEKGYTDIKYYTDADEMLTSEKLDGVMIGTRCSLHTHYALLVAKYNLPIFLEKPVCITEEEIEKLETILHLNDKIVVSFPLRLTMLIDKVKELVDSGKIGTIEHIQAYNNVPYARGYYHQWYRDDKETGGLFIQKATHDFDYINYLLGDNYPVRICAVTSKQVFKGNEPAGKKCSECEKAESCPESPKNVMKNGDG